MDDNLQTIDRYVISLITATESIPPNYAKISSLARSITKLAEASLSDQTINPGD